MKSSILKRFKGRTRGAALLLAAFFILSLAAAPLLAAETYTYVSQWGSWGSSPGEFRFPGFIAVNSKGELFVTDMDRVQKFDSGGNYIAQLIGTFDDPAGIAIDSADNIYVVEYNQHQVHKYKPDGTHETSWGGHGSSHGQFDNPIGIAVDSSDKIYVADTKNNRIQVFDSSGSFLQQWGYIGSGPGEFDYPYDIAVDSSDDIYVTDYNNFRIQKFDSGGSTVLISFTSPERPYGIAVDAAGNVYVSSDEDRIQKFNAGGSIITQWGSSGTGDGEFSYPLGFLIDTSNNVFVVDSMNSRIQQFALLLNGDNGIDNGSDNGSDKGSDNGSDNGRRKLPRTAASTTATALALLLLASGSALMWRRKL